MEKKNKILIFAVSLLLDENKRQLNWDNMTKREISKLFEDRKIRTVWDDKEEAGQGTGQCPTHFSQATGETKLFRRTLTCPLYRLDS